MDIHDYYRYNIQETQYMTKNNYVTPESICHQNQFVIHDHCGCVELAFLKHLRVVLSLFVTLKVV